MKGALMWQDSGSLGATLANGMKVAADSLGRATVVYQMTAGSVTETVSIVEHGAGLPWSAPAVIYSGTALMMDTACDAAGDLMLALSIGSGVRIRGQYYQQHLERDDAGFRERPTFMARRSDSP